MCQLSLTTRARFREVPSKMLFDSCGHGMRGVIGWFAIHTWILCGDRVDCTRAALKYFHWVHWRSGEPPMIDHQAAILHDFDSGLRELFGNFIVIDP